ncbi:hypothetical protein ACQPZF_40895 [Actinosynnema sp. CS-041913]|uniref:hypothetical protein n=1 Tax=Actinosynnema sp. CS-041913 TaxID=3239917 RepID=UPI003D90CB26
MTGFRQISDHRFEGYDNPALAGLVEQFKQGDAAQKFSDASHALRRLSASLADTDEVLRRELAKLGIEWQGAAGENAGKTITAQADYAGEADDAGQRSSQATAEQSANYSNSRNGLPESDALRGDTETNLLDDTLGFVGYETDHAQQVKETQAAREQVIRGLDQYVEASRDSLNQYQSINKPPNFEVTTTSSAVGTPVAPVHQFGGGTPTVTGGGVPGTLPGGGLPGGLPGGTPLPGGQPGLPPQLPGGGTTGITPLLPGQTGTPPAGPALPVKAGGSNLGLGLGLGLAGGLALGTAAATARGGKVVRNPTPGKPGEVPQGTAKGTAAAPGGKGVGGVPPGALTGKAGISATIGAIDPDERAPGRSGAAAGSAAGKAGAGSMLQPAASGKSAEGEDDAEHIRKYGVDSDDVFGDERMVVQSVIGDEPEQK